MIESSLEIFLRKNKEMIKKDISTEEWREYEWIIPQTEKKRVLRIDYPLNLYYEKGSSCHVITHGADDGKMESICVPAVGHYGCVLRWRGRKDAADVTFVSSSKEDEK